jgi:hypothetical protein
MAPPAILSLVSQDRKKHFGRRSDTKEKRAACRAHAANRNVPNWQIPSWWQHLREARPNRACSWQLWLEAAPALRSLNKRKWPVGNPTGLKTSKLQNFLNSAQIFRIASTIFLAVPKSSVSAFPAALAACTTPRSTMRMRARCSIPCTISNSLPIPTGGRPRACTQGARLRDFIYTLQRPDVGLLGGAGSRPHSTQLTRSYI